ncbi:PucR family transcriptional regulator [Janibacter melonis]|uniref:PucR family transcriptional regulator n=1 Tax=Janibacter melonis TaxID=262209 RepID=UPI00191A5AAC|nr:helix-turn-helix domain-containing protein [Janibacter melonis]
MRETPVDGAAEQVTLRSVLAEPLLRSACPILDGPDDAVVDWARPALEVLANESDLHRTVVVGDDRDLSPAHLDPLARRGAVAVLVREPDEERWRAAGPGSPLPVVGFRAGASVDAVVRLVAQLALAHESHVLRYATRVHETLAVHLHRGSGVEAICQQLERLTGCAVAFLDATSSLHAVARDQEPWLDSTTAGSIARQVTAHPGRPAPLSSDHHLVHEQQAEAKGIPVHVLSAEVSVADRSEGWLVLVDDDPQPAGHDVATRTIALQQAVGIVATEMLRTRSVERAEERARGNFVHALLHGRFSNSADLSARAAHRRFPVDRRYGVVVLQARGLIADNDSPQRLANMAREALRLRGAEERAALSAVVGDVIAVVREVAPARRSGHDSGTSELAGYATALHRRLQPETDRAILVTYGRPIDGAMRINESYREARIALALAAQLGVGEPAGFTDMRVYATLLDLALDPRGRAYAHELVSPLREASGDLDEAVETYIEAGGNLTQAARDLQVHRNTMLYKLERASKAVAQDLRDPETQFAVWLALKLDLLARTADAVGDSVESG